MRKTVSKTMLLGLAAMLPAAAMAQTTAYTNQNVNMRAGPNAQFPLVTSLPAGAPRYDNHNKPRYDDRAARAHDPTRANIRDERPTDRPITGEKDQTSKSHRTYSQQ